jgi:2-haloalkanoic acid dehalogenase type II
MAIIGRWPRAIFYDSKTTLFDWAWTWTEASAALIKKYSAPLSVEEFRETWVRLFEGFHRRTAFYGYKPVTELVQEALMALYQLHGIPGAPGDVDAYLRLQKDVRLFAEVEDALSAQQARGVKVLIYSDVETSVLDLYVSKFKKFKPDFVGTTEQAGVHKPNPRTYTWVLRKTGLEPRDVIYCAAPMFDIQGAIAYGLVTAWLRRKEGRLAKQTHEAAGAPADFEIETLHDMTAIVAANRTA